MFGSPRIYVFFVQEWNHGGLIESMTILMLVEFINGASFLEIELRLWILHYLNNKTM